MKFLLAPDSFKESLTAKEAADAMEVGLKKVGRGCNCPSRSQFEKAIC